MPLPAQKNSSFTSDSFFIFTARFFPSLASLFVVIWYSRHLTTTDYGLYQHFWIQMNILYPVVCMGIHVLLVTYSPDFIKALALRISSGRYVLYFIWMLLFCVLFAWLQHSTLAIPFFIPLVFMLVFSMSVLLEAFLIVHRKFPGVVTVNVLYSLAFCIVHWYVLRSGYSLASLFSYLLVITLLRFVAYGMFAVRAWSQTSDSGVAAIDVPHVRSLWLHLGFYDVVQSLFNWIDKFIISLVLTASMSAIYFNGSQNVPFLPLLLGAAGSAALMQLAGNDPADDRDSIVALMNKSGRVLSSVVFPVFCFLLLFRREAMLFLSVKYIAAIPVFAMSVLVIPVRAYSFTTALQRLHRGDIINKGSIADLLIACLLMYPLYRLLGLAGVALSFVISTYLQAAYYLLSAARLLSVNPLRLLPLMNWIVKIVIFFVAFYLLRWGILHWYCGGSGCYPVNAGLMSGAVLTVVLVVVSLYLELKRDE
jgi:O-antigen/teichoic acid export membrane protein